MYYLLICYIETPIFFLDFQFQMIDILFDRRFFFFIEINFIRRLVDVVGSYL